MAGRKRAEIKNDESSESGESTELVKLTEGNVYSFAGKTFRKGVVETVSAEVAKHLKENAVISHTTEDKKKFEKPRFTFGKEVKEEAEKE